METGKPRNLDMKDGFIVCGIIMAVGLVLQLVAGPVEWGAFAWPVNIIVAIAFLAAGFTCDRLLRKTSFIRFSSSNTAAVPDIVTAVILTAFMGLTRQTDDPQSGAWLSRMTSFWPFVLIYTWMAWILLMTSFKQARTFTWRKFPAILCHKGLLLAIACGTLGSADMQRQKLVCHIGETSTSDGLPFSINLVDFSINEYAPTLVALDKKEAPLTLDKSFREGSLAGWNIRIDQLVGSAMPVMVSADSTTYTYSDMEGAVCAVHVVATKDGMTRSGWVTDGTHVFPAMVLDLPEESDGRTIVAMPSREPERFTSVIKVISKNGGVKDATVEVNHPAKAEGWKIYQYSYDTNRGRWSDESVFELVRDPWIVGVYAGIVLLLMGAAGMFLTASKKEVEE